MPDAEALDAIGRPAALKHWLTDPCPDCLNGVEAIPNGIGDPIATGPCRTCDGRGWVPKEGLDAYEIPLVLVVPLDWLEDER